MDRRLFAAGALAAGSGVALGAFAAHALRSHLAPEALALFETGVRYQMNHALAMLVTAVATMWLPARPLRLAGGCFLAGIVLFSGSLYALALGAPRAWGVITPFGGVGFLAGWSVLVVASVRRHDRA